MDTLKLLSCLCFCLLQYTVFFEFNDRMEAVMKKAYIYRSDKHKNTYMGSQMYIMNKNIDCTLNSEHFQTQYDQKRGDVPLVSVMVMMP